MAQVTPDQVAGWDRVKVGKISHVREGDDVTCLFGSDRSSGAGVPHCGPPAKRSTLVATNGAAPDHGFSLRLRSRPRLAIGAAGVDKGHALVQREVEDANVIGV